MITPLSSISLHFEYDLVAARRRARQIAALLGFEDRDQTRIATVASEIARNALRSSGGGRVEFAVDRNSDAASLLMTVTDGGPMALPRRVRHRDADGHRRAAADGRSADQRESRRGTTVTMRKGSVARADLTARRSSTVDKLTRQRFSSPLEEINSERGTAARAGGAR
jgi:anti-sigma regulatory factor (Ser/Thr protein kinase)